MGALSDKVGLVTGAASGIGRAVATAMAAAGAAGVVLVDIDESALADAADELGATAIPCRCDVRDPAAMRAAVGEALGAHGALHVACNAAGGTGPGGIVADYDLDAWRSVVDLNLTGVLVSMQAEISAMRTTEGGAIVNVSSGAGLTGFSGLPAYVASKHGVIGLTRAAALDHVGDGIRVNAVCPGTVRTPMLAGYLASDPDAELRFTRVVPMKRLGEPAEIADAIVWLCSEASSFVTGQAIPVDGGTIMR